jgi:quercetin dioxygenase-like cupin family protein
MRGVLLGLGLVLVGAVGVPAGFGAAYWFDVQRPDVPGGASPPAAVANPTLLAPLERSIPIADAFPELAAGRGHVFRARKLVLPPGAQTETLRHDDRPAITYVAFGEAVERREGAAPRTLRAGEHTLDTVEVVHSWANESPAPVVLLIGEIVPAADAAGVPQQ